MNKIKYLYYVDIIIIYIIINSNIKIINIKKIIDIN